MRTRSRQAALAVVLVTPVVWTVMVTPPFVGKAGAQVANGGMLGPGHPVRAGSSSFYPTAAGMGVYDLNSPWDCNGADSEDSVAMGGGSPYESAERNNEGTGQRLRVERFTGGLPIEFEYDDDSSGGGAAELIDMNGDMAYDMLTGGGSKGGGTPFSISFSLELMDESGEGEPDHVSIPWSQISAMGWLDPTDGCNDGEPQVWVPLADTDGDGAPDSIVLDLNGDSNPDPEFYRSPRLVAAMAVPTMDWLGLVMLGALLTGLALWTLSRRETSAA